MNICFIVYDFMEPGGINTVVRNISDELAQDSSLTITILDLNPKHCSKNERKTQGIRYHSLPIAQYRYPIQFWINLIPIYIFLKKERVDVAFVEGTDAGFFVPPLQLLLKTKLVFCDHGALCNQLDNKKATLIRYMASKLCCHSVALTQKTQEDYIRLFHIKPQKLSVIYNYVDCPVADDYNISSKKIISIGRLTQEKGMDLLLQVAAIVLPQFPDWSWDVYGDGPLMEELTQSVKAAGTEQLHFLGNVEDAALLMKNYSICVLPSYREGLPLVLIEALMNRLPAVSFDIDTGPRDIIKDMSTGFLAHPYQIADMTAKIISLIENEPLRKELSYNCAKQQILFNKQEIIGQWKKLIKSFFK